MRMTNFLTSIYPARNFVKNILDCYASDRDTWMQFATMDDNPEAADMQRQTFQKLETMIRTHMGERNHDN